MKYNARWLLVLLLFVMGMSVAAQAQTQAESPTENACYAGGSMEDKCDWPTDAEDDWAWTCGYYIARFENGVIASHEVPDWCNYFADESSVVGPPVITCYFSSRSGSDFSLVAALNVRNNAEVYNSSNGTCSGGIFLFDTIVSAADQTAAEARCDLILGIPPLFAANLQSEGYNTPSNWWVCAY